MRTRRGRNETSTSPLAAGGLLSGCPRTVGTDRHRRLPPAGNVGGRKRIDPGAAATRALSPTGQAGNYPVMLIDGVVGGVWHMRRSGRKLEMTVEPLGRLTAAHLRQLEAEAGLVGEVMEGEPILTIGTVTVGPRDELTIDHLDCIHARWCGTVPSRLEGTVQLRAHGEEHRARVRTDGDSVSIELLDPASGIAPGQAAVIYEGTRVVGSATIASTARLAATTQGRPA